jgi:YbbR domain-containing protein
MHILRHNLGMKLISFVLALLVWGFARASDPVEERGFQLGIVVKLDPGIALADRTPDRATEIVNVRGPSSRLARLTSGDPKAVLDARGMKAGETRVVQPHLEPRIRGVQTFFEDVFEITVDSYARASFTPEEVTDGNLPAGFFIEARIGLPSEVLVEGAQGLVSQVARVAYFLDLGGLEGSTEVPVEFQAVDKDGSAIANLSITPPNAMIGISLQPSQASKTVPVVVDYQGTPASNYAMTSLSSDPFLVEVSGPAEALSRIVNVRTAPINLTGKTASFQETVALLPPAGGLSLTVNQAKVSVVIEQLSGRMTFEDLMIELRGVDDTRYTYSVNPETVNVTISGGVDRVAQVTAGYVHPQIYLDSLGPGTHHVRVSVNVPSGVGLGAVEPSEVTVVIEAREGSEGTGSGDGSQSGQEDTQGQE